MTQLYFNEIKVKIDQLYGNCLLLPFGWGGYWPATAGQPIKIGFINDLRNAIKPLYTTTGHLLPAFTLPDPMIAGQPIRAQYLIELRNDVDAVIAGNWCGGSPPTTLPQPPVCGCHGVGGSICNTSPPGCLCECGCFTAGTEIDTPNGSVPIEKIKVGDSVYSYDEGSNSIVIGTVGETFIKNDRGYDDVELSNGLKFEVTPSHRFFVPHTQQWIPIEQIKAGTELLTRDGTKAALLKKEPGKGTKTAYNFHVLKYRNYFVHGILVHNIS